MIILSMKILLKKEVIRMNKDELGIEIHNKEELLRCYENDVKNAKNEQEKARWDHSIQNVKAEISHLQSSANQ